MYNPGLKFRYLLHRIAANNRHGIHSPFVYRLVDNVIYDFRAKNAYPELKKLYSTPANDPRFTLPQKVMELLYRIGADFKPLSIVMTPAVSTAVAKCLQLSAPGAKIYRLNAHEQPQNIKADLIYIEAEPGKDALALFNQCMPYVTTGTMLVLQNVHQSRQGKQAWAAIKAHPRVTVTIDLFWLQLVYFREGQAREDFRIKY